MATQMIGDFPSGLDWLNSPPLSLAQQLRGKIVVLDFWTFCCINCMHILPDLAALEKKYAKQPVVFIGVHSPKFDNEKRTENIKDAVLRYGITHPIVNDPQMLLWQRLGVRSWPTLVVLGPDGSLLAAFSGEGHKEELDDLIERALEHFASSLDFTPLPTELVQAPASLLLYPGKVAVSESQLFISDSNHNRLLITDFQGQIIDVIGSGQIGMVDGSFAEACFFRPQGLALQGEQLFVADTENHALRLIDLKKRTVSTLAGTGVQGYDRRGGRKGRKQELNSPWDVVVGRDLLYIAMAGTHQIWTYDLRSKESKAFSGSGAEARLDSDRLGAAAWAQPSGLVLLFSALYIADSESSSIRMIDLEKGSVSTLAGGDPFSPLNLFAFGDTSGIGFSARLQHPLGLCWSRTLSKLVIADSYNHRLKLLDPKTHLLENWVGDGTAGKLDGDAAAARFSEPAGVIESLDGERIYVADTNNHAIRVVESQTGRVTTLAIRQK